nr:chitinase II [Tanacetum cinerariifolium]
MQQMQDKAKKSCMVSFRQLHSQLKLLSNNNLKGTRTECGFKCAFATLFGQDVETFIGTMFLNMDQLEKQLDKEEFQEIGSMAAFKVLETQFQTFIKSQIYLDDEYVTMTRKYFLEYTQLEIPKFHDTLIQHMESVKKSIDERAQHKQDRTESRKHNTSSSLGNDVDADDADIKPVYNEEPMVEGKESACAKPHHMIAPSSSRYSSNNMVHNHYLEEAKKKIQKSDRNSRPSVMPSTRSQSTVNGSKPKPRINNQKSKNCLASKTSYITTKTVPIAEHSRNSRNFFDSKHFVCSTCQKCVFNANHDACVTKFLNEVRSRAKVSSNKTMNRNKPVEQISVEKKLERQIPKGHRFLIRKTTTVNEKTMTPRSYLSEDGNPEPTSNKLLVVLSGKKNYNVYGPSQNLNLLEYACVLWKQGIGMDFIDPSLDDAFSRYKLISCMQVALPCVEENWAQRPAMLEVSRYNIKPIP